MMLAPLKAEQQNTNTHLLGLLNKNKKKKKTRKKGNI